MTNEQFSSHDIIFLTGHDNLSIGIKNFCLTILNKAYINKGRP